MNLLVTGGAGFIGCNLIRHVIDFDCVNRLINLDSLTYAGNLINLDDVQNHPKYHFENVDIRDPSSAFHVVQKHAITHVLHLAAESHVDRSIVNPGDFIHTNVLGTYHLLEACRQVWSADQCRFVHVSTDEVYGSLPTTGRFTESSPYAPSSPYSASKAASDLLVRAYFKTYAFPSIVTNCSNNFGPYQFPEKLIPVTIKNALADTAIPIYGDGLNVRDWLYVRDHVDALWKILLHGRSGEAYNIGGGNELTNLQLVEQVCDIVDGLRGSTIGASRRLISFVSDRLGHDRRYAVDSRKMECELKWKPRQPLQDCLRETVRWYLVHQDWVKTVLSRLETAPK